MVYRCKPVANTPKVCWNKLFGKLCLVDWLVLEYIEWKVQLTVVKKLCLNMIQTIQLQISFQLCQKYLLESTILFTQYILTPVYPLNTIYQIIYFKKEIGCVEGHMPIFILHNHFNMSKKLHLNMIQTIQLHISFQMYQKYLHESTVLLTQYILTPVHPLNTIYQIIYFKRLCVVWGPHTHFHPPQQV